MGLFNGHINHSHNSILLRIDSMNLPEPNLKLKQQKGQTYVFDPIRKKWLILTPEEHVRQTLIYFLVHYKSYPASLISLEQGHRFNRLKKRTDIVIYNRLGVPIMLLECKASHVPLTQKVVEQVSVYNQSIGAKYLCISNGVTHYCWYFDREKSKFVFLQELPDWESL